MSSSESESENIKQISSAIDHDFISCILKKANSNEDGRLPSLRPKEVKSCKNELGVTPEFQKHVAKHLDAIILRQIKEVRAINELSSTKASESKSGVKLFSKSKVRISKRDLDARVMEQTQTSSRKKKLKKTRNESSSDDSSDELQRLNAAAVSTQWVLEKQGAYGKCCERGKVMHLKDMGNGLLIENNAIK